MNKTTIIIIVAVVVLGLGGMAFMLKGKNSANAAPPLPPGPGLAVSCKDNWKAMAALRNGLSIPPDFVRVFGGRVTDCAILEWMYYLKYEEKAAGIANMAHKDLAAHAEGWAAMSMGLTS